MPVSTPAVGCNINSTGPVGWRCPEPPYELILLAPRARAWLCTITRRAHIKITCSACRFIHAFLSFSPSFSSPTIVVDYSLFPLLSSERIQRLLLQQSANQSAGLWWHLNVSTVTTKEPASGSLSFWRRSGSSQNTMSSRKSESY